MVGRGRREMSKSKWKVIVTGEGDDYTYNLDVGLARLNEPPVYLTTGISCNNERDLSNEAIRLALRASKELGLPLKIDSWTKKMIRAKRSFHHHSEVDLHDF
jgi:hypothetical protein